MTPSVKATSVAEQNTAKNDQCKILKIKLTIEEPLKSSSPSVTFVTDIATEAPATGEEATVISIESTTTSAKGGEGGETVNSATETAATGEEMPATSATETATIISAKGGEANVKAATGGEESITTGTRGEVNNRKGRG